MVGDMEVRCTRANGIKELVRQLFAARPISSESRDAYDKRFIAEAISLLFSGYSVYETWELSSEVGAINTNQKHIITSVRALETATEVMESNFVKMTESIERPNLKSAIGQFEIHLTTTAMQASSRCQEMLEYLEQLSQGLFKVLGGKLDPLLIEPSQLHDALVSLTHKAEAKGYNAISTILPHVFELQTSMYVHEDKHHIDIITHVPLVMLHTERFLWKRTDIPYILPFDVEDMENGDEMVQRGQINTVWNIEHSGNLIAADESKRIAYELPRDVLEGCLKIGDDYFCRHIVIRKDSVRDSCDVALFRSQMEDIHELCSVILMTIPETAISLTNRETIFYGEEQIVDINCKDENGTLLLPTTYPVSGLTKITLPAKMDCSVSILKHEWRADEFLEIAADARILPMTLNESEIIGTTTQ